jgi:hypothetical protein
MVRRVRRKIEVEAEEPEDDFPGEEEEEEEEEFDEEAEAAEDAVSPDEVLEGETYNEACDRIEAKYLKRARSPLRAIRAFCVICMGCQPREVGRCTRTKCALYPMRFGRNPFQRRKKK